MRKAPLTSKPPIVTSNREVLPAELLLAHCARLISVGLPPGVTGRIVIEDDVTGRGLTDPLPSSTVLSEDAADQRSGKEFHA